MAPQATGTEPLNSGRPQRESLLPQKENANFDDRWVPVGLSTRRNDLVKILLTPDCYFSAQNSYDGWFHQNLNQQHLLDDLILQVKNRDLL